MDVRLFGERQFCADSIVLFCAQCAVIGQSAYGAIYLQRVLHFAPLESGLAMLLFLAPMMVCAPLSGVLYDRYGVKVPVVAGLSLATMGFVLETQALPRMDFAYMAPALVMIGAGMGLCLSQTYTDGTAQVAENQRGRAFGALDTVRQLGGAMGMAAIGTVVVGMERGRFLAIADASGVTGPARAQLEAIMGQAIYGKAEAVRALMEQWPGVASALRASAARSIAEGYYVGSVMLAVALLAVLVLMRGRPQATGAPAKVTL